jgi:hypothetical protein
MSDLYVDPIIKKYQDLITAAMPGVFKAVYQGDPIMVPKSNTPALIISKSRTLITPLTNAEDEHEIRLILTVITDIRDEISDDKKIMPGVARLYAIIEGREDATYKLKEATILHTLRSNIVVDSTLNLRTDLGSVTTSDYGLTIGKRDKEALSVEGQVEFVATFSQLRA